MIKAAASEEHQRLVKALIDQFTKDGFRILEAAYEEYDEPKKTGRHEPDIRAYNDSEELVIIGEAKTCDDLSSETTKEQFIDFSNRSMSKGKSESRAVPFHIITPKSCSDALLSKLKELGLEGKPNITPWSL